MSLGLATLPDGVAKHAADSIGSLTLAITPHDRPQIAGQIQAALGLGLLKGAEVRKALSAEHSGRSLAKLGCTLLRRFAQTLGCLPTIDASVQLAAGADWLSEPAVREVMRSWFNDFVKVGALSEAQIKRTLPQGDGAMLTLLAEGWKSVAQSVANDVAGKVGPLLDAPVALYVSPAVFDGASALEREHGPVGVSIETPQVVLFTLESLNAYKDDDRLPLLMAALERVCRTIRCLEVLAPADVLDGDQMYCEWMDAIKYHAAEAIQPDGSIRVPDMLCAQLSEEFGIEIDDEESVRRDSIERLLAHYNNPGVLTVAKISDQQLPKALRVAAGRGGRLGSVLAVIGKALAYLDAHTLPAGAIRFSADEESDSPALVFAANTTGFEDEALYNRFTATMESGCAFGHVVDSEKHPMDLARFALREASCISSITHALECLNEEI